MRTVGFRRLRAVAAAAVLALAAPPLAAAPKHGIAMYGDPALPPDFVSLPYVNPDAPKGGRIALGTGEGFDSLNPFILKGRAPSLLRYVAVETLLGRSWDEPFTLYGLLAESVETDPARSYVEFTLRQEARFSDGTPVTPEDVIWSYEILGSEGHPRYHATWDKVAGAEITGPRSVRFTFTEPDREMPLIMGLRPILKKAQWEGLDFASSGTSVIPITTAPYRITGFEPGRFLTLTRDPGYWGRDLPFMAGQANFDEIRLEFFTDASVMFEAFTGGILSLYREADPARWETRFDFPAVASGDVVKSVIPHARPSGIRGFAMNTRRPAFADWRVREAMIQAFNFEFINATLTDGRGRRITSYFSNSVLGMADGPATGAVRDLLLPFVDSLPPGALDGYALPVGDGTVRNRANLRQAMALLEEAGYRVENGAMLGPDGAPFGFEILLDQGNTESQQVADIFADALSRLGVAVRITAVDDAEYTQRTDAFDFDMTWYVRGFSLSPGNEQRLYWGSAEADTPGSRNWMGIRSPAVDAMIDALLTGESREDFVSAARALDRALTAGRYVIPVWHTPESYIAHRRELKYPETLPVYGDWIGFMPDVWWYEE